MIDTMPPELEITSDAINEWQILPLPEADVRLWPHWLATAEAAALCGTLMETLDWQQPTLKIAGREHKIPRLQAWYGDAGAIYTYSGRTFQPCAWTAALAQLKQRLEQACGCRFNSMLANWYRTGADSMGLHADNEPELGPEPTIASLSLGATRRFIFKPAGGGNAVGLDLANGDLLLMAGSTQRHWRHGINKTKQAVGARINLTFRWVQPVR